MIACFTERQNEAIVSTAPLIIVGAGPGSGKTKTLCARVQRLVGDGIHPDKIALISFTNAAAREIEARLDRAEDIQNNAGNSWKVVKPKLRVGYCGTLHGFALRTLKAYGEAFGYGERLAVINPEASEIL